MHSHSHALPSHASTEITPTQQIRQSMLHMIIVLQAIEDLRIKYIATQDKKLSSYLFTTLHGSSERRQTHAKQKKK